MKFGASLKKLVSSMLFRSVLDDFEDNISVQVVLSIRNDKLSFERNERQPLPTDFRKK
jgi:hypothetical protein